MLSRLDKIARTYAPIPVDVVLNYVRVFDTFEYENAYHILFGYDDNHTGRNALILEDVIDLAPVLRTFGIYTKTVPVCRIPTQTWNIRRINGQRSLTGSRREELRIQTSTYTDVKGWLNSLEPYAQLKSTHLGISFDEIFNEAVCIAHRSVPQQYMSTHIFHIESGEELGVLHWQRAKGIATGVHIWTTDGDIRRRYSLNTLAHCYVIDFAKSLGDELVDYLYYYDYKKILQVKPTYYGGL